MCKSGVSFDNACSFLKCINSLNTSLPWICEMIDVEGDIQGEDGAMKWEMVELWQRDPVECVEELIGNPAFQDMMVYVLEHVYTDLKGESCVYNEMWMGEWWWETQVSTYQQFGRM